MKKLTRLALDPSLAERLESLTSNIARRRLKRNRQAISKKLWKQQAGKHGVARPLRLVLEAMAPAPMRCMYCSDSEGTDIEHFRPRAKFPRKTFVWSNLLLACSSCNSNHKRERFPVAKRSRKRLLLNPTYDDPLKHLSFVPRLGLFDGITQRGRVSIEVFALNRQSLAEMRKRAWINGQHYLRNYATGKATNDANEVSVALRQLREFPYPMILASLFKYAQTPTESAQLLNGVVDAIKRHPELESLLR